MTTLMTALTGGGGTFALALLGALLLGLSAVLSVGAIGIELARFHG